MRGLMRTPIKYPGSKNYYVIKHVLQILPPHAVFIEPFCGGASIFFAKPKAKSNWLNDIDAELITTYKVLRDNPDGLIEAINGAEISKENYRHFKMDFKPRNDLERALRWLYLDLNSYPDTINLVPKFLKFDDTTHTNMRRLTEELHRASRKLQHVDLTVMDFAHTIKEAPEGAFLFIDPPYSLHNSPSKAKKYLNKFGRKGHTKLATLLRDRFNEIKFMLCYRADSEAESLYTIDEKMYKKVFRFKAEHPILKGNKLKMKKEEYSEMVLTNYKI